jgi:predicted phage terminase large subunit-like protein
MTENQHRPLNAVLRNDFQAFSERSFLELNPTERLLDNWSLQAIAEKLNLCAARKIKRLVIAVPPRSLKSLMASVAFPAYLLGRDPSTKIIAISYNQDLATKFSNDTRSIMKCSFYKDLFPHTFIRPANDKQDEFETTEHGFRYATSVGGPLTGRGANFIIIDDPLKANEVHSEIARKKVNDWFSDTALSRLDNPKEDVIVVVMQRLHVDDLAGRLIDQGGWDLLSIPAVAHTDKTYDLGNGKTYAFKAGELLHPARLGQAELDERKKGMGTAAFHAQYLQSPVPPAGNIFKWEWFKLTDKPPEFSELVMSVDVAASLDGNFSAFTLWGHRDSQWFLIAVYRHRFELPEVRQRLRALDKQYRPDLVVIEKNGVGEGLAPELRREGFKHIDAVGRSKGKKESAELIAPMIEGGRVCIAANCPGLVDFRDEVIAFPDGKYSDQVDSMVQILTREADVLRMARHHKRAERKQVPTNAKPSVSITVVKGPSYWQRMRHY